MFGASSDLQIYHNGTHSWISEQGTGSLITLAGDYQLNNAANTQNMITATDGGAVTLYTAGAVKFATTANGVKITGGLQDVNSSLGSSGQYLTSTGTAVD